MKKALPFFKKNDEISALAGLIALITLAFVTIVIVVVNRQSPIADLRGQAYNGVDPDRQCSGMSPTDCNGHPEACECLGNDPACTRTICTNGTNTNRFKNACLSQGRSWCAESNGYGCCPNGYTCRPNGLGCVPKRNK